MSDKKIKNILTAMTAVFLALLAFYLGQKTAEPKKAGPTVSIKKEPAPVRKKKKPAVPVRAPDKTDKRAKAAIVIDDFGYNRNNLESLFGIKEPVTLSVLPNLPHSKDVLNTASERGYEVILHLPMESSRKGVSEEPGTIRSGENKKEALNRLNKDIDSLPGIKGVSNHMGSRATEDEELMEAIFESLKKRGLYFFDSLTSENSVCRAAAKEAGIRFARRDMFLDNSDKVEAIELELAKFKAMVLKRGRAIAICHDRKNTMTALSRAIPGMSEGGIEFVSLSDMVRVPDSAERAPGKAGKNN